MFAQQNKLISPQPSPLSCANIHFKIKGQTILNDITLEIPAGKISALIGPNGSGKSTLLKLLTGLITPNQGYIDLNQSELSTFKRKEIAKYISFLPQRSVIPDQFTVEDLIVAGRYPHQGLLRRLHAKDQQVIHWALDVTEMTKYRQRHLHQLSGGQQQRAWLAMILAQETPLILLDEPTTYLDIKHQLQMIELIKNLNINHNKTILWVLHDLNQAIQNSDYLFVLKNGQLITQGTPKQLITDDKLAQTFEITIDAAQYHEQKFFNIFKITHRPTGAFRKNSTMKRLPYLWCLSVALNFIIFIVIKRI
ncbi:ABC transporter ATP-binding protein [Piscirickettsia litoralis]|uniref:ABC transporter ATP-binding protein n=1 Tax=Piscirickettsia litoralis TaxID=1891921 RepID=UPI0009812A3A|nr:ABC transporter ATP-binding protein [Piscirickettsia litoralis]